MGDRGDHRGGAVEAIRLCYGRDMPFDTHAAVKTLTAAVAQPELAEAVVTVAQDAHGDDELVTRADLTAAVAGLDARMASMETRLTWRIVGAVAAIGAILRFLG